MPRIKFEPENQIAYDKVPVQLKVLPGVRDQLRQIPGWQKLVREYLDRLISEHEGG
jgi:hypothetical protein